MVNLIRNPMEKSNTAIRNTNNKMVDNIVYHLYSDMNIDTLE